MAVLHETRIHKNVSLITYEDGTQRACKITPYEDFGKDRKKQLCDEINILRTLDHKRIIQYFNREIDKHSQHVRMICEYCVNGDLLAFIKQDFYIANEEFTWKCASQMSDALAYIQNGFKKPILHRDVKSANVFLTESMDFKLGDFGFACELDPKHPICQEGMGTPIYSPLEKYVYVVGTETPEDGYGCPSDTWALGAILYEMIMYETPFSGSTVTEYMTRLQNGFYQPPRCSKDLGILISEILEPNVVIRLTAREVLFRAKVHDNSFFDNVCY